MVVSSSPQRTGLASLLTATLVSLGSLPNAATSHPTNVETLYTHLNGLVAPRVGVLSAGNFDSVHQLLPNHTVPVVFADKDDIVAAVLNGSINAGLISGVPNAPGLATFTSTLISPRGMFTCRDTECDTLVEALNAAIVRALNDGAAVTAARANPPFEYVAVHTCKTNAVTRFPFPTPQPGDRLDNASARGALRIAALGPYNWSNDGDYTASPPVGFWPDMYDAIEAQFRAGMGFGFERVWQLSSVATMDMIINNEADATEPYWTVDAFYGSRSRLHTFALSCTTLGYDSTFFVRDTSADTISVAQNDDDDGGLSDGAVAAIVLAVALAVGVLGGAFVMMRRERELKAKYAEIGGKTFPNVAAGTVQSTV